MSMFEWLQTQPEKLATFGKTMAAANLLKTKGVMVTLSKLFPFDGDDHIKEVGSDVLLVDVGGGKGKLIERFRQQRPDLRGRMILQDLPNVIEGKAASAALEYMEHDFFNPQPVIGMQFSHLMK